MLFGFLPYLDQIDTTYAMKEFFSSPFYQEIKSLPVAQFDRRCYDASWEFMRRHPRKTLSQWWRKTVSFWRLYPRTDKVYTVNEHGNPGLGLRRGALVAVSLLFEPFLFGLGLWGAWKLRPRWAFLWPLPVFVMVSWSIHVLVVSMMRYRLPSMPYFIVLAAYAIPGGL